MFIEFCNVPSITGMSLSRYTYYCVVRETFTNNGIGTRPVIAQN